MTTRTHSDDFAEQVLFALDRPKPQHVRFGEAQVFGGIVVDVRGGSIEAVAARFDDGPEQSLPVNLPSDDIGRHLPHLARASRCRFAGELVVPVSAGKMFLEAVFASGGGREPLAVYDLAEVRNEAALLRKMSDGVERMPAPPPEIVQLTQGHSDVEAYRESIVPGIVNLCAYLSESRVDLSATHSLLDFGCGSGRLLQGWFAEERGWRLAGCDINDALIRWARETLPPAIDFRLTSLTPPLDYPSESFDLVTAVSVFTHLGRERQDAWAIELARILRPGGVLVVTLHGLTYVNLFVPQRRQEFETIGRIEIPTVTEGSNDFAAFHSLVGAKQLFADFDLGGFFPAGRMRGLRRLFPVAAFQDVYVFLRR